MIHIKNEFMDVCQECPCLALDVDGEMTFAAPGRTDYVIRVRCKNKRMCSNVAERIRAAMEHEEQKEDAE